MHCHGYANPYPNPTRTQGTAYLNVPMYVLYEYFRRAHQVTFLHAQLVNVCLVLRYSPDS